MFQEGIIARMNSHSIFTLELNTFASHVATSASGTERTFERCPTAVFQLSVERQAVHGKPTNGSGQLVMALQ